MERRLRVLAAVSTGAILVCILNIGLGTLHAPSPTENASSLMDLHLPSKNERRKGTRPSLDSILHGKWNITGDASWLLQFAVVGFPKCGTSTMMFHLGAHPQVSIFRDERCDVAYNQQAVLVKDSYLYLDDSKIRGFKCPSLLESTQLGMRNMQRFFPKTSYIVGIRHPVLWFESFYNFRIHNEFPMPSPNSLVGRCKKGGYNVCTFRANFHLFLSNLLLTPMTPEELGDIDAQYHAARNPLAAPEEPVRRRVFLYEVSQLTLDRDGEADLRRALQTFLGLSEPIQPFIWFKPGRNHQDNEKQRLLDSQKMDICEEQYSGLREVLMQSAVNVSHWIRQYFLEAPAVHVSNKEHFTSIMTNWEKDPCLNRVAQKSLA